MKIGLHEVTSASARLPPSTTSISIFPSGELVALLRPIRIGQDHAAAHHRRPGLAGSGRVRFDGEDALSRSVGERNVGFVFQRTRLSPHDGVRERGVRTAAASAPHRPREAEIRAGRAAARAGATRSARQRLPAQLSGGQRQASRSRARSPSSPAFFCSTSRSMRSTPRFARSCGAGFASSTTRSTSPPYS